ncbi:asparaginase [Sinomonas sp. JGH33]|uniref:Asparaginase n=1 Tax=Sinomonas terricola TaxID=3110330 RepID=A0ABU5TA97_9MICC|nr:asparaginase [Sinomonas sp. JGH33]MEA5456617.1 asparaginase [Sinomonas sp. JGH33]
MPFAADCAPTATDSHTGPTQAAPTRLGPAHAAPAGAATPSLPAHVPLAVQTRGGVVEGVHYGSVAATASDGSLLTSAGDPRAAFFPRSALKPLQAVALVRAGLNVPAELLALAAASHSGAPEHRRGALRILALHGLDVSALENTPDLPYGAAEREAWLRSGGHADRVCQNCSGKHAAMAAVCTLNGWSVAGYLDPAHPLQQLVAATVSELTGERPSAWTTDGCGTPLPAMSLTGMARAYGTLARAGANDDDARPGAEAAVARAMAAHPHMVAGEGRDVVRLMRLLPGAVAKDGFEGVQLVGLPDGRAVAVKISDGGDRARMPVAVRALKALGVVEAAPGGALSVLAESPVLGGGRPVGTFAALESAFSNS